MQIILAVLVSWQANAITQPADARDKMAEDFAMVLVKGVKMIAAEHVAPAPQPQMIRWAIEGLYKEMKEPIPADLAERMKSLEKAESGAMRKFLIDARRGLARKKGFDDGKALIICFHAIFIQLEPGGEPRSKLILEAEPWGKSRSGIGLTVDTDKASGMLRVVTVAASAYKAGIRAGDVISHFIVDKDADGNPLDEPMVFSTKGMSVERADELMYGAQGTSVRLIVIPAGSGKGAPGRS